MAIDATDWEVTRSSGNIRYIGDDHGGASPSYATVIELHRWLQGLADDASSSGDDELDITDENPSSRSTDNIITLLGNYNIDDATSEHLYDGSIIQGSGGTEVIYDGIVNFGNSDVQIQVIQNGAVLTDDWWNFSGAGLNPDAAQGISHRFMIKTRNAGSDIDGRRLLGTSRTFGNTYAEFPINGTARGNNVLALSDATDLNNQTGSATVATWDQFANDTEGYKGLDVDNDGSDEYYYSEWDIGGGATPASPTINDLYEYAKYVTRDGAAGTLYGISGELFRGITHQVNLNTAGTNSGTFSAYEQVSWTGGTGQMLAIEDTTASAADTMWIQLLTGSAPGTATLITGGSSSATATTTGATPTVERTVSVPFIGASTGSAIIGAYGIGVDPTDLSQNDSLTDLSTGVNSPPNYVTFTVAGLVSGEDRVLVAPWDGTSTDNEGNPAIDTDQLSLNTTLSSSGQTAVVCTASIPTDTPSAGTIRVVLDDGRKRRVAYTSYSSATFTTGSTDWTDPDDATAGNDVYVSYIDETASGTTASFTSVYDSDRDLVVVVRDGGGSPIKQFISSATLGSSSSTITAIRTSDT